MISKVMEIIENQHVYEYFCTFYFLLLPEDLPSSLDVIYEISPYFRFYRVSTLSIEKLLNGSRFCFVESCIKVIYLIASRTSLVFAKDRIFFYSIIFQILWFEIVKLNFDRNSVIKMKNMLALKLS